jgi:hypothetical protein
MKKLLLIILAIVIFNASKKATAQNFSEKYWYSYAEYLGQLGALSKFNQQVSFLMKDTLAVFVDANGNAHRANDISHGSIIDPTDNVIDYTQNPEAKVKTKDEVRLDSIQFPYVYVRNTQTVNSAPVVDTLIIAWYTTQYLSRVQYPNTRFSVLAGGWDSVKLMPKTYFKMDTILLTADFATNVINNGGGYENQWQQKLIALKAPEQLINSSSSDKLFGYTLHFRSGMLYPLNAILVYQRDPATLPPGSVRPNYFGTLQFVESSADACNGCLKSSYSTGLFATNQSSFKSQSGYLGYIPGQAYSVNKLIYTRFKIGINRSLEDAISLGDTSICRGQTSYVNVYSGYNLYEGTKNLGNGFIELKPHVTTVYTVKNLSNVVLGTQTIHVADSVKPKFISSNIIPCDGDGILQLKSTKNNAYTYTITGSVLNKPYIVRVNPRSISSGSTFYMSIEATNTNFELALSRVKLVRHDGQTTDSIVASSVNVVDETNLYATFNLPQNAVFGHYNLIISNNLDGEFSFLNALTISGSGSIDADTVTSAMINTPGTYLLKAMNEYGCEGYDTLKVTKQAKIIVGAITGPRNIALQQVATYSIAAVNGATVNWTVTGGTINSGQGTNSIVVGWGSDPTGKVMVTTNSTCTDTSSIDVSIGVGLKNEIFSGAYKMYPNPVKDVITVEHVGSLKDVTMSVYDALGRLVYSNRISEDSKTHRISVANQPNGMYFIEIMSSEGVARNTFFKN